MTARRLPDDAFEVYLSLGTGRSYTQVAEHFGVARRTVVRRASKEGWQERLAAIEARARVQADTKAVESIEGMNTRHLKEVRLVQAKALEALKTMPLKTAIEAVRALDLGIRHERLIRGEPSERTAVDLEAVVRREYERWLLPEEQGGESDGET